MIRVELSVVIPAPLPEVFAYASDWRKWDEWYVGVSDFLSVNETTQGNGAQYAYKARLACFSATVVTEIIDYAENVGWKGIGRRGMRHATYWHFEAVGDQTRFTHTVEGQVPIPVLGALIDAVLLRPQWHRIVADSLANLRRHFEALKIPGAPATTHDGA